MSTLKVVQGSFWGSKRMKEPKLMEETTFGEGGQIVSGQYYLYIPRHYSDLEASDAAKRALKAIGKRDRVDTR